MVEQLLRLIPSVHEVLGEKHIAQMIKQYDRTMVKKMVTEAINAFRQGVIDGQYTQQDYSSKEAITNWIINDAQGAYKKEVYRSHRRLINGTGILLHTNMGRAPLPQIALQRIGDIGGGYSNLEFNVETGKRGSRYETVEKLLLTLTGAESAMVVNNNAAAVFIALNTLAYGQEVIISRAEQVEIGGSFRIPDIITRSGAKMVEVGTTNRTYIHDYGDAITEDTALLLKVHKSNYRIEGFTEEVSGSAIANLAGEKGLIVMEDLGSGCLLPMESYGLAHEPTVKEVVETGIHIITFSGDKLLGGPQAGIIVGKQELINKMKKNPLTRMVRIDKLSLIALESVLMLYLQNKAQEELPYMQMLSRDIKELESRAMAIKSGIEETLGQQISVEVVDELNSIGGGALPKEKLPSIAIALTSPCMTATKLHHSLRLLETPIVARLKDDHVLISMRTLFDEDYDKVLQGICYIINKELSEL